MTLRTPDLEAAVDAILSRAGERVVCGTPLGLGCCAEPWRWHCQIEAIGSG